MNYPKKQNNNKSQQHSKATGRFYLAASLRGPNAHKATLDTIQENIQAGIARAEYLRDCLPNCVFYCPHEHEPLFLQAFKKKYMTSRVVLPQCFSILQLCDALLVCTDPEESEGVRAEIAEAKKREIPIVKLWRHLEHEWPGIIADMASKR